MERCAKQCVAAWRKRLAAGIIVGLAILKAATPAFAAYDVMLYASDFTVIRGQWSVVAASTAAGGQALSSADQGWSTVDNPLAVPTHFVEAAFSAPANTAYHVRLRLRAASNSKYNDSVWVQFSDAVDVNASRVHAIGSTAGLLVNLENCAGCGVAGWGWHDTAYWLQQATVVSFASTGTHTIRIQTREDGVQITRSCSVRAAISPRHRDN